jgi:Tfp pilus assembly protein PilN
MRSNDNINLLGTGVVDKNVKLSFSKMVVGSGVAAILMLGIGGYVQWKEMQAKEQHAVALAKHKAEVEIINNTIQEKNAPGQNVEGLQRTLQSYTAIQNYLASQPAQGAAPFSAWMEILARSIPDGLWLTSIEFSASTVGSLSLSGMAKSNESLTAWVEKLNDTVALDGKQKFDVLDIKQNSNNSYWSFVVKSQGVK